MGRFKAPSLRNIAVTAPYMHDGSIATLEEVIAHYEAGGRTIAGGPHAGDGSKSPLKSSFVKGFTLTPQERKDLVAFLKNLTDEEFLHRSAVRAIPGRNSYAFHSARRSPGTRSNSLRLWVTSVRPQGDGDRRDHQIV